MLGHQFRFSFLQRHARHLIEIVLFVGTHSIVYHLDLYSMMVTVKQEGDGTTIRQSCPSLLHGD